MFFELLNEARRATGRSHAGEDPESRRARLGCTLLGTGALLLMVGVFMAQKDLRLRLFGERAQGEVAGFWQPTDRYGRPTAQRAVRYEFTDRSGRRRSGDCRTGAASAKQVGDAVEVLYYAGDPQTSKLAEDRSLWYLLPLLLGLVMTALPAAALFKGARLPAGAKRT